MLKGALVGLGMALIIIGFAKIKSVIDKHNETHKKYWVCPNCHQKNFNSYDECPHCKTKKLIDDSAHEEKK